MKPAATYYDNFISSIGRLSSPPPAYLVRGNSDFLIEQCWNALVNRLSKLYNSRIITARYSAREITINDLMEILSTIPMGGIFRLLFLNDAQKFDSRNWNRVEKYLQNPTPKTCLFMGWYDLKGNPELEKKVRQAGGDVILANAPRYGALTGWIKKQARLYGKQISNEAAALLVQYLGDNLRILHGEIEKAALFVGEKRTIEEDDLLNITSVKEFYSIFELTDYIASKNTAGAIRCLQALINSGESPLAVLGILSRHVRLVWQVKSALENKLSEQEISKLTGLPSFVVKKMIHLSERISEKELRKFHKLLVQADYKLKTSQIPPYHLFTNIIFQMVLKNSLESAVKPQHTIHSP